MDGSMLGLTIFGQWMNQYCPQACCIVTVAYAHNSLDPDFSFSPTMGHCMLTRGMPKMLTILVLTRCLSMFMVILVCLNISTVRLVRMFEMHEGCGALAIGFLGPYDAQPGSAIYTAVGSD